MGENGIYIHRYRYKIWYRWVIDNILDHFWWENRFKGSYNIIEDPVCAAYQIWQHSVYAKSEAYLEKVDITPFWRIDALHIIFLPILHTIPRHKTPLYIPTRFMYVGGVPRWWHYRSDTTGIRCMIFPSSAINTEVPHVGYILADTFMASSRTVTVETLTS